VARGARVLWQADWSDATGQRCRRVLGTSKRAAERALSKLIAERDLELSGGTPAAKDATLEDVCLRYLAHLTTKRARPATIHDASVALDRMRVFMLAKTVGRLSRLRLVEYREHRLSRGRVSHKTINTEVATLQAALNYAQSMGLIHVNPLAGLPSLPVSEEYRCRITRAPTDLECARIIVVCEASDRQSKGIPRAPLLRFMQATGTRYCETVALTWGDLNIDARSVTLRAETTKTKKGRTLPILPELVRVLLTQRARHAHVLGREPRQGDGIFLTPAGKTWPKNSTRFRVFFYRLLREAGIERSDSAGRIITLHSLRHAFVTRLARSRRSAAADRLGIAFPVPAKSRHFGKNRIYQSMRKIGACRVCFTFSHYHGRSQSIRRRKKRCR
jgi:integrase/recombinase XerD